MSHLRPQVQGYSAAETLLARPEVDGCLVVCLTARTAIQHLTNMRARVQLGLALGAYCVR
jgi:hypothetical protein